MAESRNPDPMKCPRCETDLRYTGTKEFHEGPGGGLFSDLTELFAFSGLIRPPVPGLSGR